MPKWVLQCPNCKTEFEHSQISDVWMASCFDPPKPKVPPAGVERDYLPSHRPQICIVFAVMGLIVPILESALKAAK